MTIYSMTGFGAAQISATGWRLQIDCRSVNHRGLDVRVHLPRQSQPWSWLEPIILKAAGQRLSRGRVEIRLDARRDAASSDTGGGDGEAQVVALVDEARFLAVCRRLETLKARAGLGSGPPTLAEVLSFADVFALEPEAGDEAIDPAHHEVFEAAATQAIDALLESRRLEGEALRGALLEMLEALEGHVRRAEAMRPEVMGETRQRLVTRLQESLEALEANGSLDEGRLVQELAFLAERSDIAEEIARAHSHIEMLRGLLGGDDEGEVARGPVGKKIDFYLQELIRETNTMGSKSSDSRMTDAAVACKSLIEQMREQAANIE